MGLKASNIRRKMSVGVVAGAVAVGGLVLGQGDASARVLGPYPTRTACNLVVIGLSQQGKPPLTGCYWAAPNNKWYFQVR